MFKEQYRAAVRKLKAGLPESSIYINTIMPVQEKAVEKEPILAHLEEFNTAIREVCAEEQVTCIETGDLAREELYEPEMCIRDRRKEFCWLPALFCFFLWRSGRKV